MNAKQWTRVKMAWESHVTIRLDVLWFASDTQEFEMPAHGHEAKFATVQEALACLRAKYGQQCEIAGSRIGALGQARMHAVAGCDVSGVEICEYPQTLERRNTATGPEYRIPGEVA